MVDGLRQRALDLRLGVHAAHYARHGHALSSTIYRVKGRASWQRAAGSEHPTAQYRMLNVEYRMMKVLKAELPNYRTPLSGPLSLLSLVHKE